MGLLPFMPAEPVYKFSFNSKTGEDVTCKIECCAVENSFSSSTYVKGNEMNLFCASFLQRILNWNSATRKWWRFFSAAPVECGICYKRYPVFTQNHPVIIRIWKTIISLQMCLDQFVAFCSLIDRLREWLIDWLIEWLNCYQWMNLSTNWWSTDINWRGIVRLLALDRQQSLRPGVLP